MTTKYSVEMKNCYGIPALTHEFSFDDKNKLVAIYAPNGSMKTSFARSFKDYSQKKRPRDIVYPDRESLFRVRDQDGTRIAEDEIFVVDSINEEYSSEKMSTLLASKELKAKYDKVYDAIGKKRDFLLKSMRKKVGITKDLVRSFTAAVGLRENDFLTALGTVEREVKRDAHNEFSDVIYKTLFDPKVIELLQDDEIKKLISGYSKVYDRLLEESKFFKRGVFNHTNANQVAKNLKDNGWFKGGHTVSLKAENGIIEISDEAELEECIEAEKLRILNDPTLGDMFTKVDAKLNTRALQNFRDHLLEHPYLVPELQDINSLKRRVWIAYLTTMRSEYTSLLDEYDTSHEKLKAITKEADAQLTLWEDVIEKFNERFWVPFEVKVTNKADAVLGIEGPQIEFEFKDSDENEKIPIASERLSEVLSNGERRALYILNIIFEVEARRAAKAETLLIVDDIADSFDYKNKYAIVEYLRDIAREDHFHLIVLTHNFDFYRTVKGRLNVYRPNKLIAGRFDKEIKFQDDPMGDNPIQAWTKNLNEPKSMIGCIPFVRNLAEYKGDTDTYNKLTNLLHLKTDSDKCTFMDLQSIYKNVLSEEVTENCFGRKQPVLKQLTVICDDIVKADSDEVSLLDKVVLSIGIRLEAERFIISQIQDRSFLDQLKKKQTSRLIRWYRSKNPDKSANRIFEQVLLMTPENIHMNSFMFEPILDMAPFHLRKLYRDIKSLS